MAVVDYKQKRKERAGERGVGFFPITAGLLHVDHTHNFVTSQGFVTSRVERAPAKTS